MQYISARNVSEALYLAVQALETKGVEVDTRNGKALEFPCPVMTSYSHSRERVLFYPMRDANPYFHLMESFWMLAGKNEVEWISNYNGRMSSYSDDGVTINGAYGYRWKNWFGKDQLEIAVHRLLHYENDRRTVVSMWDPIKDFSIENTGKDHPCNTQIMFWVRNNTLNMTVCNRSNDMIWGAYGANAVHMSVLLEYMAARIDCAVGTYYQFSNNLHAYVDTLDESYREELLETGKVTYTKHTAFAHNFTYENNNSYFDELEGHIIDCLSNMVLNPVLARQVRMTF